MPVSIEDAAMLTRRLVRTCRAGEKSVVFLVGSALSWDGAAACGVPMARGVVEMIETGFPEDDGERAALHERVGSRPGDEYGQAFGFVLGAAGQDGANRLIREAVLRARRPGAVESILEDDLEEDLDGWVLPPGTRHLAELIAGYPACFGHAVLTTNFDPLLTVALRRQAMNAAPHVVGPHAGLYILPGGRSCRVNHLHGYWHGRAGSDTLHTPEQLSRDRPGLRESLRDLLKQSVLVVAGYGGWNDVVARSLENTLPDAPIEVLWTFFEDDPELVERRYRPVLERRAALPNPGRFQLYGGVDVHTFFADLRAALEAAGLAPEAGPAAAGPAPRISGRETLLVTYRAFVRAAHASVAHLFADLGSGALDPLFVELDLARLHDRRPREAAPDLAPDKGGTSCTLGELLAHPREPGAEAERRWVVLGDAGAGKSTLARHLAWQLAFDERIVPVYVHLPRIVATGLDPFSLMADLTAPSDPTRAAREQLGPLLGELADEPGRVWLLLDSFDEVAPDRLADCRAWIETWAGRLPNAVLCLLARPSAEAEMPAGFARARIARLDRAKKHELLERWQAQGVLTARHRTEIEAALDDAGSEIARLAQTPLMLTLVARLRARLERGKPIPRTRRLLYHEAIDCLLRRGHSPERSRRPLAGVRHPEAARRILAALALVLQGTERAEWTTEEIEQALRQARAAESFPSGVYEQAWAGQAHPFLEDVADQSGVLVRSLHEGEGERWQFWHRQFGEFLAAEALLEQGRDAVLAKVEELQGEDLGRWSEVFGFAASREPDLLEPLAQRDERTVVQILPEVDLEPGRALALLTGLKRWDGDDLVRLVAAWDTQHAPAARAEAEELLWSQVSPGDTERLAYLHYALEHLTGPVDRERFFGACRRPLVEAGITWCEIPAGTFLMGGDRHGDEQPRHEVSLAAFEMAAHPVTNAQYELFDPDHQRRRWEGVDDEQLGRHPVVDVSWWHAYLFCKWLGATLPTEAQWECACRGGETTEYWSGDGENDLSRVGWYSANAGGRTHAVGELKANPRGLCDVHGNVWEWCRDRWHGDYEKCRHRAGDGLREIAGASNRVIRGGSWSSPAVICRSAYRYWFHPGPRWYYCGFRPARASRLAPS